MKMLTALKILEMAWVAIGVFSLVMGAYYFNNHGWDASKWFFAGAFMAAMFYSFRRRQRKRFEEQERNSQNKG